MCYSGGMCDAILLSKLKEILSYDKDHGVFRWKTPNKGRTIGKIVGSTNANGYSCVNINYKRYHCHRLVWLFEHGKFPDNEIDHIDHDANNNHISNLRDVTHAENIRNKSIYKNNISGTAGVYWDKDRKLWRSEIFTNRKKVHLGRYVDIKDAIAAREEAKIKYGFHPNHA